MADSRFPDKILGSFWGRFFVVILQTILVSQLLLLSFLVRLYVNITLLKYVVVLLVGLLSGFSTRRFLSAHTRILQLLAALISTALSLASLYILSAGFLGMDLFFRSTSSPDWHGLIQYGVAALGSLLVINAFRKRSDPEEPQAAPELQTANPQPRAEIKSWLPKFTLPSVKKQESKISKIAPAKKERISAGKSAAKKASNTLAIQKTAPKKIAKPAASKKLAVAAPLAPKTKKATSMDGRR